MAILKCKMCGGDLDVTAEEKVVECEYCGCKQTIISPNDEKKINLSNRANRLRINCEFDKAAGIYEQIIAEFPEEAEAYWGLCLCNYGIEYVDDPATANKVPTCHRASFDKMRKDENYELALENADMTQRMVYEEQAKEIDRIMGEILSISRDEDPYDIFICYKETDNYGSRTPDSVLAQDIYDALIQKGYRVFFSRITLEDKLGTQYEPYIFSALNSAKVMLVVGTDYEYMNAVWVKNEWSRFIKLIAKDKSKALIPCYQDMDPYDMPNEFNGLQSQDCSKIGFMQDLTRGIDKLFGKTNETNKETVTQTVVSNGPQVSSLLERAFMFLEDKEWDSADEYAEKVLDIEPKNGQAYLVKLLVDLNLSKESQLEELDKPFEENPNYEKSCRFDETIKTRLESYIDTINERNEQEKIAKQEAYEKKLSDIYRLVEYAKNHDFIYSNGLKNKISKLNNERKDLLKEKTLIESIPTKISSLQIENDSLTSQISKLENEREGLGIFATSKKKEIDSKVAQLKKKKANNESKIDDLNKTLSNKTVSQIDERIKEIENDISNVQLEFDNLQNVNNEIDVNPLLYVLKDDEALQIISSDTKKITSLVSCKETQSLLLNNPELDISKLDTTKFDIKTKIHLDLPIQLGTYANEKIEWQVISKENGKALIITKNIIESKAYNTKNKNVTWETCTLRYWLNMDFYNSAFSEKEKSLIQTTNVSADKNPKYSTNPGNVTKDKVFLLSITEVRKYFTSDDARKCKGTSYAKSNGLNVGDNGNRSWWLRSPGLSQFSAAGVNLYGDVIESGNFVGSDSLGVRPALWINLES